MLAITHQAIVVGDGGVGDNACHSHWRMHAWALNIHGVWVCDNKYKKNHVSIEEVDLIFFICIPKTSVGNEMAWCQLLPRKSMKTVEKPERKYCFACSSILLPFQPYIRFIFNASRSISISSSLFTITVFPSQIASCTCKIHTYSKRNS